MDKERVIICTPGRTGSSLLCAILAEAGADFGIAKSENWDPAGGAMEHPRFARAAHLYEKAMRLGAPFGKPERAFDKLQWSLLRRSAKAGLSRALPEGRYFKSVHADLAIQPMLKLGYKPRVILSYRRFSQQAASLYMRSRYYTTDALADQYCRVMRNGLLAINLFGGCVVGFSELQSPREELWARSLADATGLSPFSLLAARRRLSRPIADDDGKAAVSLSAEADRLFEQAEALRGALVAPSRPAGRVAAA